jgi:potassium efflux system protein
MDVRRARRGRVESDGRPDAESMAAETHARSVFRFSLAVLVAVGLYGIWSDALPLLGMLERVELWPRVAVSDPVHDPLTEAGLARPSERDGPGRDDVEPTTGESGPSTGLALPGARSIGAGADAADEAALTLWRLLQALLAAIVVAVLARNLPGLVDLILRRRASIDRGARVALTTLVRYTILIAGVSMVFGLLGVSWSKIQWLAAALTFGLGFGLQEIVANFVSGLILLLERPVRVGDAVTVGNLGGVVSQIHIRATTITLWDRSEMIVPNKEFITTKLVNWTLSDSRRRSEIALRIAHGSDLGKVKETLVRIARDHPDVHEDPPPHVLLIEFGDDAIKLELRFFVDFGKGLGTKDELLMTIDREFRERGIEFAMPRLDIAMPRRLRPRRPGDDRTDGERSGTS